MARTYTVDELRTRAKRMADLEGSSFVSDPEWLDNLNVAYGWLYDLLVASGERYYQSDSNLTLTSTNFTYALPATFYKAISVDFLVQPNKYVTLKPFMEYEKTLTFTGNIPAGTVRLRFTPQPAKFTTGSETVDGIAGWEELMVTEMAIMAGIKEETDISTLTGRKRDYMKRIEEMAQNRDMHFPGRIQDVSMHDQFLYYPEYASLRYRIYGNNIEFQQFGWTGV